MESQDERVPLISQLEEAVREIPTEELPGLIDFAGYLALRAEQRAWSEVGLTHLASLYGDDEPEYSVEDIRQ
ncbi:MAG: hypothetical protein ACKVVT_12395 [Dehalococcoidia bacterium]